MPAPYLTVTVTLVHDLLGHVQKLVQVHTSEGELPEGTLLLDLGIGLEETNVNGFRSVFSSVSRRFMKPSCCTHDCIQRHTYSCTG